MKKIFIVFFCFFIFITSCAYLPEATKNEPSQVTNVEKYFYYQGREAKTIDLKTEKRWEGDKSTKLTYHANKAPWILNAKFTVTSKLSSAYDLQLGKKTEIEGLTIIVPVQKHGHEFACLVNDTGDFIITIQASGVKWSVKVGIE